MAKRVAQPRKFYVRIKQRDHERLAVSAQVPGAQRVRRMLALAALWKCGVAHLRLDVACVGPGAARDERGADLRAAAGAFAIEQSKHDRAEHRHRSGVVADSRPRTAR